MRALKRFQGELRLSIRPNDLRVLKPLILTFIFYKVLKLPSYTGNEFADIINNRVTITGKLNITLH